LISLLSIQLNNITKAYKDLYLQDLKSPSNKQIFTFINENRISSPPTSNSIWDQTINLVKGKYTTRRLDSINENIFCKLYDQADLAGACTTDRSKFAISFGTKILVFEPTDETSTRILEGHINRISGISFSFDGKLMASKALDGVRLWRTDTWETVLILNESTSNNPHSGIAFHPKSYCLATLGKEDTVIRIWDIDNILILRLKATSKFVYYTSAKIVLVGESNVGKSCLAMRLADDRYPKENEQGTTHGMRFWPMSPEKISIQAITAKNERRDVILWDMGGQDEYRLVHQLFLHDTTLVPQLD
jgi:WD40 repeat protein